MFQIIGFWKSNVVREIREIQQDHRSAHGRHDIIIGLTLWDRGSKLKCHYIGRTLKAINLRVTYFL